MDADVERFQRALDALGAQATEAKGKMEAMLAPLRRGDGERDDGQRIDHLQDVVEELLELLIGIL